MSVVQVARSASLVQVTATRPQVAVGVPSVLSHNDLLSRSTADAHPTSAITGLDSALALKAALASPALTGVPTAPTAAADTSTTQIATTAFAKAEADAAQAAAIAASDPAGTAAAAVANRVAGASSLTVAGTLLAVASAGTARHATVAEVIAALGLTSLTAGAVLFASSASTLDKLALGAAGRLMVAGATAPEWSAKLAEGTITGLMTFSKAGTTAREMTFPDAALTVAGANIDNAFSVAQTIAGSVPGTPAAGQVFVGGGAIKAGGAITATGGFVSALGLLNTGGEITSRADEDAQTILGRICCGFFSGLGDNASFAHYDFATSSSYALRQDAAGATAINSATGQTTTLRVNNTIVFACAAASIVASQNLTVPNGTAAAPGIRLTGEATGWYRSSATAFGASIAGVSKLLLSTSTGAVFRTALGLESVDADQPSWIYASLAASALIIGGNSSSGYNAGGTVRVYGTTHATKPDYIEFQRDSTVSAYFDNSGVLTVNTSTASTTTATGALVVTGGVGVGGAIYAGAQIQGTEYRVSGTKVLGAQGAAVADATGGATVDAEARTAINALLARMRAHGAIAT